jgi:hydrogenase-4 membrane subunit HyfE
MGTINMVDVLRNLAILLETGLLVTAFLIAVTSSISRVIRAYRLQSLVLALVTGLVALQQLLSGAAEAGFLGLIVLLPLALAGGVRYLLARATAHYGPAPQRSIRAMEREAERVWRNASEKSVTVRLFDVGAFLGLVAFAFLVAYQIFPVQSEEADQIGLMVSLSLHLTGLYNMVFKRDLISQILGLLIMDHGLYLAVVKVVPIPELATFFVISLYFYTLITMAILVFLLPQVRRVTGEIDLDEIARRSELKG